MQFKRWGLRALKILTALVVVVIALIVLALLAGWLGLMLADWAGGPNTPGWVFFILFFLPMFAFLGVALWLMVKVWQKGLLS